LSITQEFGLVFGNNFLKNMKKTFHISGMHCVSCETLLEKELQEIPSIQNSKASHKKGTLEIEAKKIPLKKIEEAVQKCGYEIVNTPQTKNPFQKFTIKDALQIGGIFLGGFLFTWLFSYFEVARFFPDGNENVGFVVAFLLGIIASVSTCLALTGGIVMSFSSEYTIQEDKLHPFWHRALPQVHFHMGRVGGFFFLGGVLGLVGSTLNYSLSFTGYLTIFVAIIMLYIGLHILNIVPSITRFGFHLPKKLSNTIHSLQQKEHPFIPGIIGILTFFLPCGFTQSMQLAAVASGSFWFGGLIMAFFALGTLPVLFSVGIGSSYAQKKDFRFFKKIVGVIIIFFSLYSLNSGLVLSGSNFTLNFWNIGSVTESVIEEKEEVAKEDIQVVQMDIDYTFSPTIFRVQKDVPVRFEINANRVSGCTNEVIIPRLGLTTGKLQNGERAVLEFTPTESGVLPFSCWMGMQGGKFVVE
jgi:sulfite exporter TauE/SafE/copper chaperone CopZ